MNQRVAFLGHVVQKQRTTRTSYNDRILLGWHASVSVAVSVICLSLVKSRKLRKISAKFRHLYRKSGSQSKNVTSDFAPEVAK